jgi:aminoglycoside/choline kinase family phosphotransferase
VNALFAELKQMIDHLLLGDEEVLKWIQNSSQVIESVTRIPGDASTRKYYRIVSKGLSYIVMRMEPFADQKDAMPFLVVQRHLAQTGVDVPRVLDVDAERGFILLEDLGDVTLLRELQDSSTPDMEKHLYERVIDSLVQLQVHSSPKKNKDLSLDAFKLKFDHEKLMWEINFGIENFYQLYLKRNLAEKDHKIMVGGFSEICTFLAEQPTVLAHRDFHSRNIMVTPKVASSAKKSMPKTAETLGQTIDRLVIIDFQDARMGPPQYDLASLLKDSYYQLDESQIHILIEYYIARYEAMSGQPIDHGHFIRVFDLMSVQRNFKAIGSFASFLNRRGDASYLKYIGNTFENIRRALLKYPEYSKLRETLFHYYYF